MAEMVILRNDFHNTEIRARVGAHSEKNTARMRSKLCGIRDCTCADSFAGTRGAQVMGDGTPVFVYDQPGGRVTIKKGLDDAK